MARLSNPIEQIKDHYAVVVVGSGYGASIAASRLARAGQQVAVLERGKEFQPGDYPDTQLKALPEIHAVTPDGVFGRDNGLYELNVNRDINVFKGCGLGGTSLVNANVSLRAEPRVFDDPRWPKGLRDDLGTLVEDGYRRAEEMLKPTPYPDGDSKFPKLPKLEAHQKSASAMKAKFDRTPINVNFTVDGTNHVGVQQHPCADCGDCVTGCNYGAKNTLIMNYLPDAKNHGAEIFTETDVRWVEPKDGKWLVHYRALGAGREKFQAPEITVSADVLILGGGTLGSTEILLRSKQHGVAISDRVGEKFTGNGDALGFAYDTSQVVNGVGWGHHRHGEIPPVGPCITSVIDLRNQATLEDGMIIEEGSPPGAIAGFLPVTLATEAAATGGHSNPGAAAHEAEQVLGWIEGPYHGAMQHTQTYLVMTHDDGAGRMALAKDDCLHIDWPGVGAQPIFRKVSERLRQASEALGGEYVHNPLWSKLLHNNLITVHPLGGCVMAEDAEHGVVNHKAQVFSGATGGAVYENLYVADGSIIPRPLGVNPLLTISAVAERAVAILARDRGWRINYDLPSVAVPALAPQKVGIEFTETMSGYFSSKVKDDYQRGSDQGKADGSSFVFTLTIVSEDVDEMLSNPQHEAQMVGTVNAPALSPNPLTVTNGTFNLFVVAPEDPAQRRMRYRMRLVADEGKTYYFEGFKIIKDDPAWDVWAATTTLYITVYDGSDNQSPVLGKGILIIKPQDFLRQLTTMKATNGSSAEERAAAEARFGRFFLGVLLDKYGKVFRWPSAS